MLSLQSLRMRLGLLLVLAFAPVFALTAYWSYLDHASRLAGLEASESQFARQIAARYGQAIRRSRELLVTVSGMDEVRRLDGPACSAILAVLWQSHQARYASLDVARADGERFCSSQPIGGPIDLSRSQAFHRALGTRRFAVGDLAVGEQTGPPILAVAMPVAGEGGKPVAVAGAVMSGESLNQLAEEFRHEGWLLLVVDRSGHVVARYPDPAAWLGRDISRSSVLAARRRGETAIETVGADRIERRFVMVDVEDVPPPARLTVIVGMDHVEALATFHAALLRDMGVLLLVAFAALVTAWFGTERWVIRRVGALLDATRRLAAGDLGARTGSQAGPSELRQLGRAFDDMAAALQQRELDMSAGRKELAEQEALLRTVIDALPVGVWIVGTDGEVLTANQQAREIWGVNRAAARPQPWWTATRERLAAQGDGIARALRTGEPSRNEIVEIEAFDGTRKTVARWAVPLRDVDGAIAGAVAVQQDITARVQAEAAVRESEQRFRHMAEHLPMMIWLTDASGAPTYINPKWFDFTGMTPEDALGLGWTQAIHADDRRSATETFLAANAMQLPFSLEYRLRRHDGEYRHCIDPAAPRIGPSGEFLGYVGCVIDIHDRKMAGEHLRLAVEAAPSAMIMADDHGAITLVNSQAERLFGYTRSELLGRSVEMLVPERFRAEHAAGIESVFKRASARALGRGRELFGARKDGSEIPIEIGVNPIRTDQGGFVMASISDISERKRAEETHARLEAQLRQAQKMEALGTLAGGIAHDFNNILSAILCSVELVAEDVGPGHVAQDSLTVIREASERARDLVQQILTFSRQQPLERRVVRLRDVAEESVKLMRATLPAGIELVGSFDPDTPHVLADRTRIHQVLMNLCTNAWQAMDGQAGRIEIALAAVTVSEASLAGLRSGRYARLSVTDTGKGMAPATVERIFDPFFTTKAPGEGTGLGLAVVDGVVKDHDGAIEVSSTPGRGTVFHLYFPAVEAEAESTGTTLADAPRGDGQRILYVDDEAALVAVAERLLGRLGYDVKGFTRPSEALAAFQADPAGFDLCVTDLNMPSVSGLEIAAAIRSVRPDLPVALASGNITDSLLARARALGIREILYKPSSLVDLAQAIQRMVSGTP